MSTQSQRFALILLLLFGSGMASLLLQVLWMRELALLFGSTAEAAAATLAAFFLGLAAGGRYWGKGCKDLKNPLQGYAWLEAAVALSASAFLLLTDLFARLYGLIYDTYGAQPALLTVAKLLLTLALLLPPSFFMGGTLPVLSRYLAGEADSLGRKVPILYGVNTLGAAAGTFAAAFVLPQSFGYRNSYLGALLLVASIAATAWWLGRRGPRPGLVAADDAASTPGQTMSIGVPAIRALAFLSGFVTLALEVLWTRMYAQVLQNSVYTYAAVLLVFLSALALGSFAASGMARARLPARPTLSMILVSAALLAGLTPLTFFHLTDGLSYLGGSANWSGYVTEVLLHSSLILMPAVLALGLLFPYLMKISEPSNSDTGRTVGNLLALNTLGAICGALFAGFVMLNWLGLWQSIQLVAALYLAAALLLIRPRSSEGRLVQRLLIGAPTLGLLALMSVLSAARLPEVKLDPNVGQETLYELITGSSGSVAVIRRGRDLRTKVNNHYTLGGTAGRLYEERQSHIPLLLHPEPRSVFYIGLGTGITAGAALHHPVEQVLVSELIPEAVDAARRHFGPYLNGLFEDPRVRVISQDGRHHLAATQARYDVVIGDLFIPWRAGAGGLYSESHFRNVLARLAPGGIFAQWIPLYQVSEQEFGSMVRSFLEVFPSAHLWRGDFLPGRPIVALVGMATPRPLDPIQLAARDMGWREGAAHPDMPQDQLPLMLYYGGDLGAAAALFAQYPINTDDRPIIEFLAPVTQREAASGGHPWLTGQSLVGLLAQIQTLAPFDEDPHLMRLSEGQRLTAVAGQWIFEAQQLRREGDSIAAQAALDRASALIARHRP